MLIGRLKRGGVFMSFLSKRAHIVADSVIGWIMWIAIAAAVGFAIYKIVLRAG